MCSRKGCDCVSLHYRFDPETSLCRKCGEPGKNCGKLNGVEMALTTLPMILSVYMM